HGDLAQAARSRNLRSAYPPGRQARQTSPPGPRRAHAAATAEGGAMRAEEQAALAVAAGRGFVDVVRVVEGVHRAVLARAYRLIGAGGRAPQGVHEGFTAGVYACVRGVGGVTAYGLSQALATRA